MNQVNSITIKAKYKHLSNDAIRSIVNSKIKVIKKAHLEISNYAYQ